MSKGSIVNKPGKEKELSVPEQIQQAIAEARAEDAKKQLQRDCNKVDIGAVVAKLEKINGKPILDKETKQPRLDNDGVPQCYPDKFKVTLQFLGGELVTDISAHEYSEILKVGHRFYCQGYMGLVKDFNVSTMKPIFTSYTEV